MDALGTPIVHQHIYVNGGGNDVKVAGRDLNTFSPDPVSPPIDNSGVPSPRLGKYAKRVLAFVIPLLVGTPPGSPLSPPSLWPQGKSALCRDGQYSPSHTRSGTCSHHGGVAQWRFAADDPYWRR